MSRALLWLAFAAVVPIVAMLLVAPGGIALRAILLGSIAVVPAGAVIAVAADRRRRLGPTYGDPSTDDPGET